MRWPWVRPQNVIRGRVAAIVAAYPLPEIKPGPFLQEPSLAHKLPERDPGQRELEWAAFLDVLSYVLTYHTGGTWRHLSQIRQLVARARLGYDGSDIQVFRRAYEQLPGTEDTPVKALLRVLRGDCSLQRALSIMGGEIESSPTLQAERYPGLTRQLLEQVMAEVLRQRNPVPFWRGLPLESGQRFHHGEQTFEVEIQGERVRIFEVAYPQPRPGETWSDDVGDRYLIAEDRSAVQLKTGHIFDLTRDGSLPGLVRGRDWTLTATQHK